MSSLPFLTQRPPLESEYPSAATGTTALSDAEIRTRFQRYYSPDSERQLLDGQIPTLRAKWASLSDYVKEIKQGFSSWY